MPRRRIMDDSDSDGEDHVVAVADMDVDAENDGQPSSSSSSSSPAPRRSLRRRLEREAGVRPSDGWLDQCLTYLRSSAGGNAHSDDDDAEGVWNQILHADLRDVVREDEGDVVDDADGGTTAARQLRAAVAESKRRPSDDPANGGNNNNGNGNSTYVSRKATLPSTFRLLIQMEEVVDVTMNGEQRLAAMGGGGGDGAAAANDRSGQNNGSRGGAHHRNPEHRCLKMAFSDGYHPDGRARSSSDMQEEGKEHGSPPPLLAMETSPIRDLSASSPPGTKLLLRGPIDVRLGLLQLHDGNVAVVGGEVEGWKEVWRKARERAQREKGLGVDPTIKALIWNPLMGDEEEADEGEGESGDVAAAVAAVPPPVAQPPQIQAPPPQQPLPQPIITQTQPTPRPNSNNPISSRVPYQSQTSHTTNSSSRGSTGNNLRQRTLDSYPKKPRPETTRLHPSNTSTGKRSRQAVLHNASNNPYQRSSVNAQSTSRAPPQQQQQQQQPPPVRNQQQQQQPLPVRHQQQQQQQQQSSPLRNQQQQRQSPSPHTRNDTNIIPIDDSPPSSIFHKSTQQPPQQRPNPYASLRPSPSAAPPAAVAANAVADSLARTPAFASNPSFSELKSILLSLRTDRALYERYFGKIITVPCKMDPGPSKVFNIVKAGSGEKKKNKMKKEKKYEFLLVGQFFGPKQSDGGIACRVESSTVGNYFTSYTPAEIRKLSREDKVRANRIVNQGSSQFIHDYSSLGQIQMKLLMAPDEFFEKMSSASDNWLSDTANPILLVVKKV